jgi:hypothetical protein
MDQFKENIVNSFRLAKNDIMKLQRDVIEVRHAQEKIMGILDQIRSNELKLYQKIEELERSKDKSSSKKSTTKKAKKDVLYIASKRGTKFHVEKCPYAHNIRPKSRLTFKSGTEALNQGLKPCECVR